MAIPVPDIIDKRPPAADAEVEPADNTNSPPEPVSPEPTLTYTLPPLPSTAVPDPMYNAPLLPLVDDPVLNTIIPLTPLAPSAPPSGEAINISPLDVFVLNPDIIDK